MKMQKHRLIVKDKQHKQTSNRSHFYILCANLIRTNQLIQRHVNDV